MRALPAPVERLEVGHVRAARDVLDGLVVDGQHGRSRKRTAVRPGQLQLHRGLRAGPVCRLRRLDGDIDDPRRRRHGDLAYLVMDLAIGDGQRLDEEVGHVAGDDADLLDRALAPHVDDLRRHVDSIDRPDEQQDRGIDPVRVDLEPERLAGLVLLPLGDDLDVAEAEARAVETRTRHGEQVAALLGVSAAVVDRRGEPVLARLGGLDLLMGLAVGVERDLPGLDGRLDRTALGVVHDLQQPQRPLAGDRLAVERLGAEARLDRVAGAVVAAVDPCVDGERPAGDEDLTVADDRPPRAVGDLGGDLVAMVGVGMRGEGRRGVDGDGDRPIGPDRHVGLGDDLRRPLLMPPPHGDRPAHAPARPARVPGEIRGEPPVARPEEPVPAVGRIPAGIGRRPGHLVMDLRLGDRPAEVVAGFDRGRDRLAQPRRGLGRLDLHLELGLLVLLDAERAGARDIADGDGIAPQRRVGGELERAVEAAEGVGHEPVRVDLVPLGIVDLQVERPAGELGGVGLVVLRAGDPDLELDRPAGAVDRPVGDGEGGRRPTIGLAPVRIPDIRESVEGEAAVGRPGRHDPLIGGLARRDGRQPHLRLAVAVGRQRHAPGVDAELVPTLDAEPAPAEPLDPGARDGPAVPGVGDELVDPARRRLLDDGGVVHPDDDPAVVPACHRAVSR